MERQVTITGTPEAQWKSQYYIYDKIRQEGCLILVFFFKIIKRISSSGYAGEDEVRLRAEINVPTSLIGRLVGKGGHNVKEILISTIFNSQIKSL